jgi:hypothetical protein
MIFTSSFKNPLMEQKISKSNEKLVECFLRQLNQIL